MAPLPPVARAVAFTAPRLRPQSPMPILPCNICKYTQFSTYQPLSGLSHPTDAHPIARIVASRAPYQLPRNDKSRNNADAAEAGRPGLARKLQGCPPYKYISNGCARRPCARDQIRARAALASILSYRIDLKRVKSLLGLHAHTHTRTCTSLTQSSLRRRRQRTPL